MKKIRLDQIEPISEVSDTQSGIVNNIELQELGGVDKLIHGVRVGQGKTPDQESTAVGFEALMNAIGGYNTGVGYQALKDNTTGFANDAFGDGSLMANTIGTYNSAFGTASLQSNISGTQNMGFGGYSLYKNTTGSRNTAVGLSALQQNNGSFNTAVGNRAGSSAMTAVTLGNKNITIGFQAGKDITSGNNNLLIENITNASITSGSNNIMLNPVQKSGVTTGSNNVIIGGYDGAFPANMSDTIVLGTGNGVTRVLIDPNGNAGIGTTTPTAKLHSVGTVRHENLTNAQGDSTFTKQVVAKPDGTFGLEDKVSNRQVLYVTGRVDQTGISAPVVTINSQDVNDAALTFTTQYIAPGWYLISVASTLVTLSNYKIEAFIQDKAFGSLAAAITDDTKFEFQGNAMVLLSLRSGALTDGITANQFSIHLYKR